MNAKSLISRTLAVALSLASASVAAELTTIAQVGAPAGGGEHYVAVLLRDPDGGVPQSGHSLFRDTGAGFAQVAQLVPTTNVTALALILQRAEAAGLDNTALERALDAISGEPAPAGTLAEKLSYVLRGEFSDNGRDEQKALLVRVFPQIAMACGAGWIGKTPSASPTTFELRATGGAGKVLGRVTTGIAPAVLPAPGGIGEVPAPDPTGHLRIYLNWWTTPALRDRTPHLCGYNVYRADRAHHISETGSPPPANYTPAALEAAITAGLVVQVNACPILPDALYEAAPPADAPHFFVDDNDTAELSRFDEGGAPFADGQEMTYYVAACDYFGLPGNSSDGLETKACDRMPPGAPEGLRAEPIYEGGEHFVKLTWNLDPEVGRYFVYCYERPDEALPDLRHAAAPETPAHVATVLPEVDDEVLVSFTHTGAGRLILPADAGKTRWYCVRAEDTSSCIDAEGFGNLSLPCGVVPVSLYGFDPRPTPNGHLLTRCCDLLVDLRPPPPTPFDGTPLQATRNNPHIRWVEFRETEHDLEFGRFVFDATDTVETLVDVSKFTPGFRFEARFGLSTGFIGPWVPGALQSNAPHGENWRSLLRCGDLEYDPDCETFPQFPIDPGSGQLDPVCGVLVPQAGDHSWRVFRRVGIGGALSLIASGKFEDTAEWCDNAIPAHYPITMCYYGQTFDLDGNPSALSQLGCHHVSDPDRLPIPDIDSAEVLPGGNLLEANANARVTWFCPRPGVERFDLAVFPIPPGVTLKEEEGGIEWGILRSGRLPNGFGGVDGTEFSMDLEIQKGTNYIVRVRARGTAPVAHPQMMAQGTWSRMENVLWSPAEDTQNGILPWPSRAIPPVIPTSWPAEIDFENKGRVAIGAIPPKFIPFPPDSQGNATVHVGTLAPFLFKPLPLTVYRHETTAGARGEMAQSAPLIGQFWQPGIPGQVVAGNAFVYIGKADGASVNDPYYIWVRDHHPLTLNKSYRYTVTCFGGDGEITGSTTSAEFTVGN